MIRTSKHSLKFTNSKKISIIDTFYVDYSAMLQIYINLIIKGELEFKIFLSSKDLPTVTSISHSVWKQIAYKQASEMVRTNLYKIKKKIYRRLKYLYAKSISDSRRKFFTEKKFRDLNINFMKRLPEIKIKNISIPIDSRLIDFQEGISFDEFILIKSPYFINKRKTITIKIPIKHHKQSLKFKNNGWNRKNTILLNRQSQGYFVKMVWEKEEPVKRSINKKVGIDVGYKKLISSSSGEHFGTELFGIYSKISRKKQGSKGFKRALIERNEKINSVVKDFIKKENPDIVYIEALKNVKLNSTDRIRKKVMIKLQRWSYVKTFEKLKFISEEEGFLVKEVDSTYTSQTCSSCGNVHKESRKGEIYECINCKNILDADTNAALVILHRGEYDPSAIKIS